MISSKLCRTFLIRLFAVLVIISSFLNTPAYSQESADSQVFISGFNAYQQKEYATTIARMNEVLEKYPDSPLRDMVLFWLSRAYFKSGNQQDAARYLSQFSREYPDNPLKGTVDEELLALTARYERGEQLPGGSQPLPAQTQPAEAERLARERADQQKPALRNAGQERQAALTAEDARKAAESAERERLASVRREQERARAEEARRTAEQAEQQRIAREKSEQERVAALQKEQERVAAAKAADAGKTAVTPVPQNTETEKVDMELVARQQAELIRQTMAKAEQKRLAALKLEETRESAEKSAKTEQKRIAALKAYQERSAAEAEEKRLAALKTNEARLSTEQSEKLRIEREKIEQERKTSEKVEADRAALEKSVAAKRAAEEAEQRKQAALKTEQDRAAALRVEKELQAVAVVATVPAAPPAKTQTSTQKRDAAAKAALRKKAIAQYTSVREKYPGSKAAATAAAKLKELGVAPVGHQKPAEATPPENAQVLSLEVARFAGLEFTIAAPTKPLSVAQPVSIPFEVINQGNGSDSFYLESGFPPEFGAGFTATATPGQPISQTSQLAPGESFKGFVSLTIPANRIDGQRMTHPIRATSRSHTEAAQSREIRLIAAAPFLRAVVKADQTQPLPGDKITYRVTILNVGSTTAQDVTLRLSFPPQLDPVDHIAAGFRQEMKSALVHDGLQIKSGESREFSLAFQLKQDSLAEQELLTRVDLLDNRLKTTAAFVSNAAYVQQKRGLQVRSASERQVVIPGQTVNVPFVVTNTGNVREKFKVTAAVTGVRETVVFHDINRDGIRQTNEPVINEIGPLAPREEAGIVVEVRTPRTAADGSEESVRIALTSEADQSHPYAASTGLLYSRPSVQLAMTGRDGRLKPGEVASFELTITNHGSNLAQVVELQSNLPEQLELVASDPATAGGAAQGNVSWKFKELGAGEKRTVKVSFRVRPGTGLGTNIQVKNTLTYEDQLGNRY